MTDKLKRCPLCGGEAETEWHHGYWGVRCQSCYAEVTADGMNDAIEVWNTRKPMDRIVEQLEEELRLSEEEKRRCVAENAMQFDSAKGYYNGIDNALAIVKGVQNE